MSKLTPWFNIKNDGQPVRIGNYQVAYTANDRENSYVYMRYWDGSVWRGCKSGEIMGFGNRKEDFHSEYWRGLANPPKQSKGESK